MKNKKYILAFALGIVTTANATIPHNDEDLTTASSLVEADQSQAVNNDDESCKSDLQKLIVDEVKSESVTELQKAVAPDTTNDIIEISIEQAITLLNSSLSVDDMTTEVETGTFSSTIDGYSFELQGKKYLIKKASALQKIMAEETQQ